MNLKSPKRRTKPNYVKKWSDLPIKTWRQANDMIDTKSKNTKSRKILSTTTLRREKLCDGTWGAIECLSYGRVFARITQADTAQIEFHSCVSYARYNEMFGISCFTKDSVDYAIPPAVLSYWAGNGQRDWPHRKMSMHLDLSTGNFFSYELDPDKIVQPEADLQWKRAWRNATKQVRVLCRLDIHEHIAAELRAEGGPWKPVTIERFVTAVQDGEPRALIRLVLIYRHWYGVTNGYPIEGEQVEKSFAEVYATNRDKIRELVGAIRFELRGK